MQTAAIIVWVYGTLVLVGGVMGWAKARSKPSLIAGLVFGVALIVVGIGINQRHANDVWLACTLAGILAASKAPALAQATTVHWLKWNDFVPAGDQILRQSMLAEAEKALGFKINMETIGLNDLQPRATAAIQGGPQGIAGPYGPAFGLNSATARARIRRGEEVDAWLLARSYLSFFWP